MLNITLLYILFATFFISALSLVGVVFLARKEQLLDKILLYLIGLSTGTLLGGAFIHLLPESIEFIGADRALFVTLVSFVAFFLLEKLLHWRHCHEKECPEHTFGYINLAGDAVHNFIDGLLIAGAFVVDPSLGFITTIALVFHELPQELGDFAVLVYSGIPIKRAVLLNFLVALTSVLGGIIGFFLTSSIDWSVPYLLPIAAGGFIYISTSDLIPELRSDTNRKRSIVTFLLFVLGLVIMYLLA